MLRLNRHCGWFVTGTDTGVGKTRIACALLHAVAAQGLRVVGMKPVAAGAEWLGARLVNEDVAALTAASNIDAPAELVNPYCFAIPAAPHIAAHQAGVEISVETVHTAFRDLAALADCVIVEGVGGFCVPLNRQRSAADLAVMLGLPVVLVVGMRLGCLNHALLTADAIRATGLPFAAWVANHIDEEMTYADENVTALSERLDAPLLARVPYSPTHDARRIARAFRMTAMADVSARR